MASPQELNSLISRKKTLKPIETKRIIENGGKGGEQVKMENGDHVTMEEEPSSPATRLFHLPMLNCSIIAFMGCETEINVDVIKMGLERTLLKHSRFSSVLVTHDKDGDEMAWIPTKVDLDNHVIVPDVDPNMDSPDQFVEDYISDLTKIPMDLSKPLWELHLLNIKTSDANTISVFRIHHSVGDGASLISLVLACTRKTSDPEELPTIPKMNRAGSTDRTIWWRLRLIWNTFVDFMLFVATVLFLKDSKTAVKGERGTELNPKRFVFQTVSLDDVKLVKNSMNMTINDILLGITQAGLSRYLNRKYCEGEKYDGAKQKKTYLPQNIRLRATVVFNTRPSAGIQALGDMMEKGSKVMWGNWLGYVLLPFKIAIQDDPLDYIRQAKATIDRRKHSLESSYTVGLILKYFGVKVGAAVSRRVIPNTTLLFSSVVGPVEEISFYGHPVTFIAPSIYGLPHALTIHYQSYANKLTVVLAVDQEVIPDPRQLCDDIVKSLQLIKNAVVERGPIKNGAY